MFVYSSLVWINKGESLSSTKILTDGNISFVMTVAALISCLMIQQRVLHYQLDLVLSWLIGKLS